MFGIVGMSAQTRFELPLYPDGAAESNGMTRPEENDEEYARYSQIARLYVFLPERSQATGRAVVICPGGGYTNLAIKKEGFQPAEWLNERGIAAIVLKYRMPNGHPEIPLKDASTAIETVRRNAPDWNIDSSRVGIMGYSAGGHLAATASTQFTSEANRPAFSILIYPVITLDEGLTHAGSRKNLLGETPCVELSERFSNEKQVTPRTPTTFLALSDDDKAVPPQNSTLYYNALKAQRIPAELHIWPSGGHGWGGFNDQFAYQSEFQMILGRWLAQLP